MIKISILGSGAFGLSLAMLLKKNEKNKVCVWTAIKEEYEEIKEKHTHDKVLPNTSLDEDLEITMNLKEALMNCDVIVVAVPSNAVRVVLEQMKPFLFEENRILFISKGMELGTKKLASEIMEEMNLKGFYGCLAGPTFAKELLEDVPFGMTLATTDKKLVSLVIEMFQKTKIDLEVTKDIIGVEYCGAMKNVFAILMGAFYAKYPHDTVKNYLLVKMIREEKKIMNLLDGNSDTVDTYAGIGDLLLTCSSYNSRNFSYGSSLVVEKNETFTTVEGKNTLSSFIELLEEKKISSSIFHNIDLLIKKEIYLDEILEKLK